MGRFIGSSEITTAGKRSEVFTVEYADGAKLHVPAAHAHLLTRYVGVKGQEVHLNRLDGRRWAKDKAAAQKAVADIAAALLVWLAQGVEDSFLWVCPTDYPRPWQNIKPVVNQDQLMLLLDYLDYGHGGLLPVIFPAAIMRLLRSSSRWLRTAASSRLRSLPCLPSAE